MIKIRPIEPGDEDRWRELWRGYNQFYKTEVADEITTATFTRLLDANSPIIGHVAMEVTSQSDAGEVIGFSHAIIHPITWTISPACYLEDLFVSPSCRGGGAGRTLIENLIALGKAEGWGRLYWHTRDNNTTARKLYDQFIEADDFVRYRIMLG